ncbi:histidine phosphatase family protein [Marisediminicola senii]|uniref:histidine phosphatase family protein n=1 Tax=Marisediminicola senii TaxID=2711233 RepID=UPI0013EC83F9|nr:histidine phosphatase family protein [Marisediminicola senii]
MTKLYLVRHGETDWNVARRIQGITDIPLNETGRAQARRTGALLATREWDAVIASPLSRAYETARIIGERIGFPTPTVDSALVERFYGQAEGMDHRTLDAQYPPGVPVPGRETRAQVERRVLPALLGLGRERPGENVVVVTHGGVIRTVINAVEPDDPFFRGVPITNGSVHSFQYRDGGLSLIAFDDPMELESIEPGAEDFVVQNPSAARESGGLE